MGWMRDTTARWLRIMATTGDESTPLDEGVNLIGEVTGMVRPGDKPKRFRKPKREASVVTAEEMVTILSRHLITGVQASDYLLVRLAAVTGQSREQILDALSTRRLSRSALLGAHSVPCCDSAGRPGPAPAASGGGGPTLAPGGAAGSHVHPLIVRSG
jgi:hypothetical protein